MLLYILPVEWLLKFWVTSLILMPMSVMNIRHVIVRMFLGGMFMLMRMDSLHFVMSVGGVIAFMAVFVE